MSKSATDIIDELGKLFSGYMRENDEAMTLLNLQVGGLCHGLTKKGLLTNEELDAATEEVRLALNERRRAKGNPEIPQVRSL